MNGSLTARLGPVTCREYLVHIGIITEPLSPLDNPCKAEVTPKQVKDDFAAKGQPVNQWAEANGFRPSDVYRVLNGFSACKRGLPHAIAVKLGIKADPAKAAT